MKKATCVLVLLSLFLHQGELYAQNNNLELSKYISLNEKMTEHSFTVDVVGDVIQFSLRINCDLTSGDAVIELIDPAGKKQGKFSVVASDSGSYQSRGKLERNIDSPINGVWVVRIVAKSAKGNVYIRSQQEYAK
jgi:hypothetical protein